MSLLTLALLGLAVAFAPALVRLLWSGRSSKEIPRGPRGEDSDYDGHHDYREEIEQARRQRREPRTPSI